MHYVTDVFLGTWLKFIEKLFELFPMYAKQKPVEYSPSGVH